jgi:hypothetical protein
MLTKQLFSLLKTNPILHPTVVRQITVSNGTITMDLTGFPWWLPSGDANSKDTMSATIEFTSVSRANLTGHCLNRDVFCEDLDTFEIFQLDQVSWNKGNISSVFCSEPVRDPISVFAALEGFLMQSGCPFDCSEFFNCGETINGFVDLTKSASFEIAKGPSAICDVVSEALAQQGVRHTTTRSENRFATGYMIQWWDGYFICESANFSYHNDTH